MLIKCPECKKQISDKTNSCPNCGFPISQINTDSYCIINGESYNFEDISELLPKVGEKNSDISPIYITGCIHRKTQLDWDYSQKLTQIIIETQKIPDKFDGKIEILTPSIPKPKCPTCQSTNIQKIGTFERTASVLGLGLLSKKINKTYKCKNCGYTW